MSTRRTWPFSSEVSLVCFIFGLCRGAEGLRHLRLQTRHSLAIRGACSTPSCALHWVVLHTKLCSSSSCALPRVLLSTECYRANTRSGTSKEQREVHSVPKAHLDLSEMSETFAGGHRMSYPMHWLMNLDSQAPRLRDCRRETYRTLQASAHDSRQRNCQMMTIFVIAKTC